MIDNRDQVDWTSFTDYRPDQSVSKIPSNIKLSDTMLGYLLSLYEYSLYSSDGSKIGYGFTDSNILGLRENDAYGSWIEFIKKKEMAFRRQLGDITLPEYVYDGLFLLFHNVGKLDITLRTQNSEYSLRDLINTRQWMNIASVLTNTIHPQIDSRAASIVAIADYGTFIDREQLISLGIRRARSAYVTNTINESSLRRQIRVNYFIQTGEFVPTSTLNQNRETIRIVSSL